MNGYAYAKCWYSFAFKNKRKVRPIHHAIIHWVFESANRSEWEEEFQLPTKDACEILGISDKNTFLKALGDLVNFGAIKILEESKNIYTARWVTLIGCEIYRMDFSHGNTYGTTHATTNATTHGSTHATTTNIKPNKPNKPKNLKTDVDADRVDVEEVYLDEEKKIEPPPKVAPKGSPTLHTTLKEIIEEMNSGYYWQAKDGKALKGIITKISFRWKNKHGADPRDADVITSFRWMMDNLPEWFRDKWDTSLIESKFEVIIKQILEDRKNGKSNSNSQSTGGISPRLQEAWELLAKSRESVRP